MPTARIRPTARIQPRLRPGASLDAGDIARLLLEIVVPKFSDGGAVFVLEGGYGGQSGQVVTRRLANRFVDEHGHPAETVLPVGEVFAFPAGSPYGEALSGAGPQVFGRPDNRDDAADSGPRAGRSCLVTPRSSRSR